MDPKLDAELAKFESFYDLYPGRDKDLPLDSTSRHYIENALKHYPERLEVFITVFDTIGDCENAAAAVEFMEHPEDEEKYQRLNHLARYNHCPHNVALFSLVTSYREIRGAQLMNIIPLLRAPYKKISFEKGNMDPKLEAELQKYKDLSDWCAKVDVYSIPSLQNYAESLEAFIVVFNTIGNYPVGFCVDLLKHPEDEGGYKLLRSMAYPYGWNHSWDARMAILLCLVTNYREVIATRKRLEIGTLPTTHLHQNEHDGE